MPHQRVDVAAFQSAVVGEISFEDDEEKEEPQHHVTEVTEDVVECTVWGELIITLRRQVMMMMMITHTACKKKKTCRLAHLRAPSGWAHRKL